MVEHGRQIADVERWLRSLRISAKEPEVSHGSRVPPGAALMSQKPALLHALVIHLIKQDRHREALDELDTYLLSYPYILSAPLHVYAGMLAFYLAQREGGQEPDARFLAQARGWFEKALSIDEGDQVAEEYLAMVCTALRSIGPAWLMWQMDGREPEERSRTDRSSSHARSASTSGQPFLADSLDAFSDSSSGSTTATDRLEDSVGEMSSD